MPWDDLPPLNSLVPFEAVVRLGGVTRAAAELHLTHGAVSRQVKALEHALGSELFERHGRSVTPTVTGRVLATAVARALEGLCTAARDARPSTTATPLVLSCEPTLMMRWLISRLPTLEPSVNLHLSAGGGPIDMGRQGVDAAIRRNDFMIADSLHPKTLFAEWIAPVCTPEVATSLQAAGDLGQFTRLASATRPTAWDTWAGLVNADLPATPTREFEHFYLSLEAAAAGLGVAIGPYALVQNDLEAGRLTAPFGFVADGTSYVYLTSRRADARLDRVHRWLTSYADTSIPPTELQHPRRGN